MRDVLPPHAIAIVGLSGRFPGAAGLDAFWRNIAAGDETLAVLTDAELDAAGVPAALRAHPNYVRRGTFVEQSEYFDAAFFGYSPREAQVIDPQHRIFLECAWEAVEHAGYDSGTLPESVGVYAGASMNSYVYARLLRNPALAEAVGGYQIMVGNDKDFLCTRVSYKLGLRGPSMTVQTACSTSLVAVQLACSALQRGECDMALAGGVSLTFPLGAGYLYQEGMILSPDGHCRPFDADARGTRAGAGAGIVVLKRLSQALSDGDTVHAVIRGIAVNNDGAGKAGYTAPGVAGQIEVIVTAQALAEVSPRSIGYVEAHGTATPLGDPIEIAALTQAFRAGTSDVGFCRLGSLKANIGHLDAAAGVAGLIKTVLALQHRELPPLVNFRTANPALQLERSPFTVSATAAPWTTDSGCPRRAAVSSFGIGGTNAHAVLEEAPPHADSPASQRAQLIVLSARSATALDATCARLADHLQSHPEQLLADAAYTLQTGRRAFAQRRAFVASDAAQAIATLRAPQQAPVIAGIHEGGVRPVAFLFSGQGSQYGGMGCNLYESEPVYRAAVDRCAAILQPLLGSDIRTRLYDADGGAALAETRFTQPALFVTEFALASLWQHWGVVPQAMLGHSIGEYVAAHLAGVMSLSDALAVVTARGRLMQQLPPGNMAAVYVGAADLRRWLDAEVEVAAVNAPALCTVSGPAPAIAALLVKLADAGIEARLLHTSHAFHSAMMDGALAPFVALLEQIPLMAPTRPYISNLSGSWITPQQATSPAYYADQARRAVQFEAGMRTLASDPALLFLEVGPGNGLATLARMNLRADGAQRVVASMRRATDSRDDGHALLEAAGRLWLAGSPIAWRGLHGAPRRRVPLPTYPFERKRYSIEAAPAAPASDVVQRSACIDDWFYAPTWTRDDSVPITVSDAKCWLVLGSGAELTLRLCASLRHMGLEPVRVGATDNLASIVSELRARGTAPAGAVNLWNLPGATANAGLEAYDNLIALAAALPAGSPTAPVRIIHVTAGAESVLDEPVHDVAAAHAVGPVLVLPAEVPWLSVRSVDLEWRTVGIDVASAVLALTAEVGLCANELQVAHRAGRRWVRRHERLALPVAALQSLPIRTGVFCLITGGLGGMGLAMASWLGRTFGARLLLTSRSALPARDTWDAWLQSHPGDERNAAAIATIREIEAAGGAVQVSAADAADEGAMAAAIASAQERFGALHGVIHAAGVSGSGGLAIRVDPADARAVFAPKTQGLSVLVKLLGGATLDFVALMSSINAVIPAPFACDYASANAVLDAFADSAARPAGWTRVVAIAWGAWRDVGMAAKLEVPEAIRSRRKAFLAGAIAPASGIEAFARVLASGRRRVVVDTYDLVRSGELIRRLRTNPAQESVDPDGLAARRAPSDAPPQREETVRSNLSSAFVAPSTETERRVVAIWAELLGVDNIGIHDDFFELGGHSLMATRVLSRIDESLGVRLALRDIFDAPTVHMLAARAAGGEREEFEF